MIRYLAIAGRSSPEVDLLKQFETVELVIDLLDVIGFPMSNKNTR